MMAVCWSHASPSPQSPSRVCSWAHTFTVLSRTSPCRWRTYVLTVLKPSMITHTITAKVIKRVGGSLPNIYRGPYHS